MLQVSWSKPSTRKDIPKSGIFHYAEYRGGFCIYCTLAELVMLFKQRTKPVKCGSIHLQKAWKTKPVRQFTRQEDKPRAAVPMQHRFQFHVDGRPAGPVHCQWDDAALDAVQAGYAVYGPGRQSLKWSLSGGGSIEDVYV